MQNYLELLKDIYYNGRHRPDRTGTGRKCVFGRQLRFDLKQGFPIVTTRMIPVTPAKAELLWFIKGSSDLTELRAFGATFWDRWGVTETHVTDFLNNKIPPELMQVPPEQMEEYLRHYINHIGPIYGTNWRNLPYGESDHLVPTDPIQFSDIPKDKLALFKTAYEEQKQQYQIGNSILPDNFMSFEQFAISSYHMTKDQLNDLVINLRNNPYSARLVVSSWIPTRLPSESMSPQDNVFYKKGALAPCHVLFQCFVDPPETEGAKPRLNLQMYQR